MSVLTLAEELDIEQGTVVAVLDSALRARGSDALPGRAQKLARAAGVSPVYLSYIRKWRSVPRTRTAARIARALDLPVEQQERWLYRVQRIWTIRTQARQEIRRNFRGGLDSKAVDEVRNAHHLATFARNAESARARYRAVRDAGAWLLESANPNDDPINYIELCLVLHDAQCVLNRNDEALWSAKRARRVAENLEARDYPRLRERIDFFRVNTIRAEAIALHNLKLHRAAFDLCEEAESQCVLRTRRDRRFWTPHMNRDKINALAEMSRFSITLAEELAQQVRAICDARADDYDPLLSLLIAQSLARAFIKHQNFKDAYRVLSAEYDRLPQIPHVEPLHQVIFLRTFARLYWKQGERGAEWKYFIGEAFRVAQRAGLEHQLNELRVEYGSALEEVGMDTLGVVERPIR